MNCQAVRRHGGKLKTHCSVEKMGLEKHILYHSNYNNILQMAKLWRQQKDHWLPGFGQREMDRQRTEGFQGRGLYDVDGGYMLLSIHTESVQPQVNPNCDGYSWFLT